MRIVVYSSVGSPDSYRLVLEKLARIPGIEAIEVKSMDEVIARVPDAEAIVLGDPVAQEGEALCEALRRPGNQVRWVQTVTAGIDGLTRHGVPAGIQVANYHGAGAPSVAETAMALLTTLSRRLDAIIQHTAWHHWSRDFGSPIRALEGRNLVIVGMGQIGRQVALRAEGWDMRIVGVTRSGKPEPLAAQTFPMYALHEALGQGDFVMVTVALANATRKLMDAAAFAACRTGALFINVSRGEVIDQVALRHALESGQIAGAGLDVTEPEPLPPGDPLWDAPNLIVSCHSSPHGIGNREYIRVGDVVIENLRRLHAGEPLLGIFTD